MSWLRPLFPGGSDRKSQMTTRWAAGGSLFPLAATVLLAASTCAHHTANAAAPARDLTVMGRALPLRVGEQAQLSATAELVDGNGRVVTGEAIWRSADESIASVSSTGLVTALRPGIATIAVTFNGLRRQIDLTIIGAAVPSSTRIGLSCGVERWSVKTLADDKAGLVNLSSIESTTIKA